MTATFSIYLEERQRHYSKANDNRWYFRERRKKMRFGIDKGWSYWSVWIAETGKIGKSDDDSIMTPVGIAYRIDHKSVIKVNYEPKNKRLSSRCAVNPNQEPVDPHGIAEPGGN